MALNTSAMTPAVLKAKEVATVDYVDLTAASTLSTVQSTGYVLPDGVAAAVNNNTTTIDGSKITTGTVTASQIAAGTITAGTLAADAISGKVIEGSVIKGASITGSVIKSSWIDYTSVGALTNWQFYTAATIPSAYEANFAHDNSTGALVVDSQGYARLPGIDTIYSLTDNVYSSDGTAVSLTSGDGIYAYDSYTVNAARRCISARPFIDIPEDQAMLTGTPVNGTYLQFKLGNHVVKVVIEDSDSMRVRYFVDGVDASSSVNLLSIMTLPYGLKMCANNYPYVYRSIVLKATNGLLTEDFTGQTEFIRDVVGYRPTAGFITIALPSYSMRLT